MADILYFVYEANFSLHNRLIKVLNGFPESGVVISVGAIVRM